MSLIPVILIVIMYLDQKKKRGQVVKINKELWISYKGPSEKTTVA